MIPALRAHRWPITVLLTLVLGMLGWAGRNTTLNFPLVNDPVSARLILAIGVSVIVVLPLYSAFAELELTLPREPRLRLARAIAAPALASSAVIPAWIGQGGQQIFLPNLLLLILLISSGLLAVTLIGELAWVIPFTLGVLAVIADGGPSQRVSRTLEATPPALIIALWAIATVTYLRRGPKR